MRVKRREGNQIREERCLRKAMSKLIVEKKEKWRLEKGGVSKCGEVRAKRKKEKGGKMFLRVE